MKTFAEALNAQLIKSNIKNILTPPEQKLEVNIAELGPFFETEGLEAGENDREVWQNLEAASGKAIKKIFKDCLERANIPYDSKFLDGLRKDDVIRLFFLVFDVLPHAEERPDGDEPGGDQAGGAPSESPAAEEQAQKGAPASAVAPQPLTLEIAQQIHDQAHIEDYRNIVPDLDIAGIEIFENQPVSLDDHLDIKTSQPQKLAPDLVMLAKPSTGQVLAVGRLETNLKESRNGSVLSPHVVIARENIDYSGFTSLGKVDAIFAQSGSFSASLSRGEWQGLPLIRRPGVKVRYKKLEESGKILCIDFGTSNTTVGTYGGGDDFDKTPTLVKFRDVTAAEPTISELLPTMVYVEKCGEGSAPVYRFGFDAKKKLMEADYTPNASFFWEIKRWINSMERLEEITDEEDNIAVVPRGDIIFAYLQFVLDTAEQQFKKRFTRIHFTAPVKQKDIFLQALKKMFLHTGRKVMESGNCLDEGTAIVYHTATKLLRSGKYADNANILILDCGGGTTDLASCQCSFDAKTDRLSIATNFENGNANFGGNNITFRVLQMLKIKIADMLLNGAAVNMDTLVTEDENQILTVLDNAGGGDGTLEEARRNIYRNFEAAWEAAEQIIPTKFAECRYENEKSQMRRNYYYLWQMAEAIKIEFYKTNMVSIEDGNREIYVQDINQYYLSARRGPDAPLERIDEPMKNIKITYKEVDRIILTDIYSLLKMLLSNRDLSGYSYYFSGQSCKINLFNNLLKEFIPGQELRKAGFSSASASRIDSRDLKKYCIEGSIEYACARDGGEIAPDIKPVSSNHIYDVYAYKGEKPELIMESLASRLNINIIRRPSTTKNITMEIRDKTGAAMHQFEYNFNTGEQEYYTPDKIADILSQYTSMDRHRGAVDNLERDVIGKLIAGAANWEDSNFFIFVLPARDKYGIYVCQIYTTKKGDEISYQMPLEPTFMSYENEALQTFFDGER